MRENDKTGGNELHSKATRSRHRLAHVLRVAPGLRNLLGYRREWLRHDAVAGVSVSAVALPTAIAYAELIGFEPVVGLYLERTIAEALG